MGPKKQKKIRRISDDMIGNAERLCACAARVGDIIAAQNEGAEREKSLKEIMESLKQREKKGKSKR